LYASGLHELTGRFGIKMHRFADDTYLSKNLLVEDIDSAKQDMHICYQFMEPFLPTEAER